MMRLSVSGLTLGKSKTQAKSKASPAGIASPLDAAALPGLLSQSQGHVKSGRPDPSAGRAGSSASSPGFAGPSTARPRPSRVFFASLKDPGGLRVLRSTLFSSFLFAALAKKRGSESAPWTLGASRSGRRGFAPHAHPGLGADDEAVLTRRWLASVPSGLMAPPDPRTASLILGGSTRRPSVCVLPRLRRSPFSREKSPRLARR